MSPETLFQTQLVLGYVAWLPCIIVYVLPRLKSMDRAGAQRAIATLHSFRFFGLAFILPGVVGPNLPAGFSQFAAYADFATGVLAIWPCSPSGPVRSSGSLCSPSISWGRPTSSSTTTTRPGSACLL